MTTIEKALELLFDAAGKVDAKQWKEIKDEKDASKIVAIAMESHALVRLLTELKIMIEDIKKEGIEK